jgi:hypothetical protein
MIEVSASTEIAAPAERVWSVLTDLERFRLWNPFIRRASGSTQIDGTVRVRVRPSFGLPLPFRAEILDREDNRVLHWRGHVLADWLASGDHRFTIEPLGPDRVRFVQRESFGGLLPRLASRLLAREAKRGFQAMNDALRTRAQEIAS